MKEHLRNHFILFACVIATASLTWVLSARENAFGSSTGTISQHLAATLLPDETRGMILTSDFQGTWKHSDLSRKDPFGAFLSLSDLTSEAESYQTESEPLPEIIMNPRQKADLTRAINLSLSSLFVFDVNGGLIPCLSDPDFQVFYSDPVPAEMKVYLTFDDGPSQYMADILDALDQYGAVATFFMLEPHIRLYPDIVQRAIKEGHALGSHGVTHKYRKFYQSTESIISEIDQTISAIRDVTGIGSPLVRLPYGSVPNVTRKQMAILSEHGYKIWDWNVDSCDWKTKDERYVNTTIKQLQKLREEETIPVILLHDMKGTAAHLSSLLKYLYDNGYVFSTLDPSMPELHL